MQSPLGKMTTIQALTLFTNCLYNNSVSGQFKPVKFAYGYVWFDKQYDAALSALRLHNIPTLTL